MSSFVSFPLRWPADLEARLRTADDDYRTQRMNSLNLSDEQNERNKRAYRDLVWVARIRIYWAVLQCYLIFAFALVGRHLLPIDENKSCFDGSCDIWETLMYSLHPLGLITLLYGVTMTGFSVMCAYNAESAQRCFDHSLLLEEAAMLEIEGAALAHRADYIANEESRLAEDARITEVEARLPPEQARLDEAEARLDEEEAQLRPRREELLALWHRDYPPGMFTVHNLDKPRVIGSYYVLKPTSYENRVPEICQVEDEDDLECPICKEEYADEAEVTRLPCDHTFHTACTWRSFERAATCPMCRAPVVFSGVRRRRPRRTERDA